MTITIKALLTAPLLDSTFAAVDIADVRGNVYDGLTVVGFSDTVTLTGRTVSFEPSGTFSRNKLYQVELAKTTGGEVLTTRDWVWIKTASGEFLAGDPNEIADFQVYKAGGANVESPQRDTQDTRAIEFDWPISGATFANSASTCKRRFPGETGGQIEALSGAITAISGVAGRYSIAYNVADRAQNGTDVVPTEVTYTLVDDNGNTGFLTLVIVEFTGTVTVLPLSGQMARRVSGTNIAAFLNEETPIAIAVTDASGSEVDLEVLTIEVVFENKVGNDVTVIADGSITKTDNVASFTLPLAVTNNVADKDWAMRNVSNGLVLVRGTLGVTYAASSD